ncbi:hypothetical protein PGH12_04670 [Chryseobacterium wangxinyae]|uniref:hypothetical protein n=1 Tax=Chryseobacterium sp. CY350 TaxID=2997336 RepID=UPI00226FE0E2|nr:hypothetical protein [Chryseobacterium sp. CY350]MCY0979421.1 hypothetical protein [Chryseobacterium sp. CY350]WBZ96443.1 hypothetical protein PGH12_04670 [Chryseobacterium sp. CY350]
MNKKIILGISFLLIIFLLFYFINKEKKVDTEFVGEYNFKIFNDSLYKQSHLDGKLGYIISYEPRLKKIGIDLEAKDELNKKDEYIFTMSFPIKNVIEYDDGIDYVKKTPIKVELDSTKAANKIYVYRLKDQNKYRLMLP